jgi:F0F1-type ATP synthase membrane subunit b/b'
MRAGRSLVTWSAIIVIMVLPAVAVTEAAATSAAPPAVEATAAGQPELAFAPAPQAPEHAAAQEAEHATAQEPAEEAHGEEEHAAEPKPWWHWPSKWINFLALVGLLYWMLVVPPPAVQDIFSFPGLRAVFAQRGAAILAARDLAARQKQEAAQLLAQSEQRLAKIEEEVAALVANAGADAASEQARAAQDGKAQADKIGEVAERELRHQRVTAHRKLRGFVADLAVNMAEKSLAQHLTADDQDRLIRDYLSRLGPSLA